MPLLTDVGNAERFVKRHGADVRYCRVLNSWYVWTGTHWRQDTTGEVVEKAKDTIRRIPDEYDPGQPAWEVACKWAVKSEDFLRVQNMLKLAESDRKVASHPDKFDTDPYLVNCPNGTLDLRTALLHPHRREDLITSCLATSYNPEASCPRWEAFLTRIFAGDADLLGYVQKALGYSLTGVTTEQVMFFLYGDGQNGKTVFVNVVQSLLGSYAREADATVLLTTPGNLIRMDLARLRGSRFASTSETGANRYMDEVTVKRITGENVLTARNIHERTQEFRASFKLWIQTNHKPLIKGTDHAIWRRVRLVPFLVRIPDGEVDLNLTDKLMAEAEGILAWMVEGCALWMAERLGMPRAVALANEEYREDMDPIGEFIRGACITSPTARVKIGDAYDRYVAYCVKNKEEALTKREFVATMLRVPGIRRGRVGDQKQLVGVGLNETVKFDNLVKVEK